jgi:multidrug transporter EmrE-like cation transporter
MRSFLLVFACTVIGALAQLFMKTGASQMGAHVTLLDVAHRPGLIFKYALGIVSNPNLFCGYAMYGVNTILLAMALKGRELSKLYPIIALTYVWVTLLSIFVLHEHTNFFRVAGIAAIVFGVSVLGLKRVP